MVAQYTNDFPKWIITGASHQYSQLDKGVSRIPQRSCGMTKLLPSVIKLQRWWRFLHSQKLRRKSAVLIQRHVRGLFARRRTSMERHYIVMIQVRYNQIYFFWKKFQVSLCFYLLRVLFFLPLNLSVTLERLSHTQSLKRSSSGTESKNANFCCKHRWQETVDKQASIGSLWATEHEKSPQYSSHLWNFGWVYKLPLFTQPRERT